MSHYKEYAMGLIDEDEFRMACNEEFAGEDDEPYMNPPEEKEDAPFGEWVTDRDPKEPDCYLIAWRPKDDPYGLVFYEIAEFEIDYDNDGEVIGEWSGVPQALHGFNVHAWMPLPERTLRVSPERDCDNCKHFVDTEDRRGCSSWECKYEAR